MLFDKEISDKVAMGADNIERAFFARQWNGPDTAMLDKDGNAMYDKDGNQKMFRQGRYYSSYRGSDSGTFGGEHLGRET